MNEDLVKLKEEVFCLKYELEGFSNVVLRNEAERWIPNYLHNSTEQSHYDRYRLACKYTDNKNVLDIACGAGKGSYLMAIEGKAKSILSCDIDSSAIRYAKHRYEHPKIVFKTLNAELFESEKQFDVIVSFETIEHLLNVNSFLAKMSLALNQDGIFIVSTPISSKDYDSSPKNPYHIQEWGFNKFQELICEYFIIDTVFVQFYRSKLEVYREQQKSKSFLNKMLLIRAIKKVLKKMGYFRKKQLDDNYFKYNFSEIDLFKGQFTEDELGIDGIGYQILIARKK